MVAVGVLFTVLSGCSTVYSKHVVEESQLGHPYSGMMLNLIEWKCVTKAIMKDSDFVYLTPILIPIMIVDLPCSIAADTLYLPFEMGVEPKFDRIDPRKESCVSDEW
jgi:uncharacterized protein YceK